MSPYSVCRIELILNPRLNGTLFRPIFSGFVDRLGLKGNERIIDFGAGPGVISEMIAKKLLSGGGTLVCLDVTKEWAEIAHKRLERYKNVEFVFGDIRSAGIPDGSVDGVAIHYVLHDIEKSERASTVRAMVKTLAKGGKIFFREPVKGSHSMPVDEIRALMRENMMTETRSQLNLLKSVFTATFTKE